MTKKVIRLTEGSLRQLVKKSVKLALNEISAGLADRAASAAYGKAREGFGKYEDPNEIPLNSYHGKKFNQGEKFLKYRNDKLGGKSGVGIAYVGDRIVLKNYDTGEVLTKPCDSVEELEKELGLV